MDYTGDASVGSRRDFKSDVHVSKLDLPRTVVGFSGLWFTYISFCAA